MDVNETTETQPEPGVLEDDVNPEAWDLGDPHAYKRVASRKNYSNNASLQNASLQRSGDGIELLGQPYEIFARKPGQTTTTAEGQTTTTKDPGCKSGYCGVTEDWLNMIGPPEYNKDTADKKPESFQLRAEDFVKQEFKTPVEHCKQCCEDVAKEWNKKCSLLHDAIERRLKITGCPGKITKTGDSAYKLSRAAKHSKAKSKRRSTSTRRRSRRR